MSIRNILKTEIYINYFKKLGANDKTNKTLPPL